MANGLKPPGYIKRYRPSADMNIITIADLAPIPLFFCYTQVSLSIFPVLEF